MDNPLFFIPLIEAALAAPNPREALEKSVQQIDDYCKKSPSDSGCIQFGQFMEEVATLWDMRQKIPPELVNSIAADLALELSFGLFDGSEWETRTARKLIESQEPLRDILLKLQTDKQTSFEDQLEFIAKKDGITIGTWLLGQPVQSIILPQIMPGTYTFGVSTGWRLLSMELTDEDLLWSRAYPDQDLPVAADTGDAGFAPSQIIHLWDGKLVVQVFPGIESGRIVIKVKDLC